ncbi:MAG: cysteine desulfurase [Myxococcales bacterium]|nr:cysteine desulfurase [Myxococcales bacterium]
MGAELVGVEKQHSVAFDVNSLRRDFPALDQKVSGRPLVYFDNAASAQTPLCVLEAMERFYREDRSNVHRGVHTLSQRATAAYEAVRPKIQRFLGAEREQEIVFTRGTTDAINLVAATYGRKNLGPGDEVLITTMEHHSNIVPWQMVCKERGAKLVVAPINDAGELEMDRFRELCGERTKIVALAHVSNALGTVNPVEEITRIAHDAGAVVLLDGAQAAAHLEVDVSEIGCDFYAFSGHKVFGPTGVGALYGRYALLEAMPPYQGGGDMIRRVTFEETTYADPPMRFEAGTPNIAAVIGLGAALDYLRGIGVAAAAAYEAELLSYGTQRLRDIEGLRLIGTAREKVSVLSFVMEGAHAHDIGTILDDQGIAVRAGHHCTQPLMDRFGVPATARASLAFYNTRQEIDRLVEGLEMVRSLFG